MSANASKKVILLRSPRHEEKALQALRRTIDRKAVIAFGNFRLATVQVIQRATGNKTWIFCCVCAALLCRNSPFCPIGGRNSGPFRPGSILHPIHVSVKPLFLRIVPHRVPKARPIPVPICFIKQRFQQMQICPPVGGQIILGHQLTEILLFAIPENAHLNPSYAACSAGS